ncbi:hypothetical protein [Moritella viscosa]|uniref:hypothetical protein n=1 Tax=Moritella viscosa TaxID=80854 RepID=UPI000912B34F|nr:hypothetical protein [Moritella viscosa]SGZ09907.1 Ribonuclease Z-tRNA 3 endonuclease-tRNase Z [Moritella viscosa]SHO17359.1 Ribonuclease Z-tRNA 3 endonuclease-tRNase Z [Moritella viscosa]
MINAYIRLAVAEFAKTEQDKITLIHEGYTVTIVKSSTIAGEALVEKARYNNISAHGAGQPCRSCGGTGRS